MKRLTIVLLVTIFATMLLPHTSVIAQLIYPPHEDPATAESAIDASSFLTHYTDILTLISLKEYENARRLIEQLKFVYIPEDLRYIAQRYNNLTLELTGVLDNLEKLLNEASTLLHQYRLEEASQTLSKAGILFRKAEILLNDLEEAAETLSGRLGVFVAPAESREREAYNRLQGIFQRLKKLVQDYLKLLMKIKDQASEIQREELKPTMVTLNLNATKVFVGGFVKASGILASNGESLPNRTITLLLNGNPFATAITSLDGSYHTIMEIPYRYVHTMTVEALYTPIGNDRGVYLASLSSPASIEVMFYETMLEVTAPDEAHPGLPIMVNGEVTSEGEISLGERKVKVLLDGGLLAEVETGPRGLFEIKITLSPQTSVGKRTLTIIVEPKGVYAGASQDRALNIMKITSEINIHAPLFILLPARMNIEGNARSSFGPLGQATVTLQLREASAIVKTSKDGGFNATIDMPLNLVLAGFQELKVMVEPAEPWHASAQAEASIFVINPANIGLTSAAFISFGAMLYTRLMRAKPRRGQAEIPEIPPPLEEPIATAPPLKPEIKFEGAKGGVLGAYVKAMKIVERAADTSMRPHITLREFLQMTTPKLNGALEPFTKLTILAERTLYSPYMPAMDEVTKTEELALSIEKVLALGAA